jgi:UDP-N-acetylmuramate dehydrogenase
MSLESPEVHRLREVLGAHRLQQGVPLAPLTTFRIGGRAEYLYRAGTAAELAQAILLSRELGIPHVLLGRGANVLVADAGVPGLVIRNAVEGVEFLPEGRVRAGAGVDIFPELINATVSRGLGGLHHFVGIPSTVGGALW